MDAESGAFTSTHNLMATQLKWMGINMNTHITRDVCLLPGISEQFHALKVNITAVKKSTVALNIHSQLPSTVCQTLETDCLWQAEAYGLQFPVEALRGESSLKASRLEFLTKDFFVWDPVHLKHGPLHCHLEFYLHLKWKSESILSLTIQTKELSEVG